MPYMPRTTYGRAALGGVGVPNKLFFEFLFSDTDVGIQFLKDVALIRSAMACPTCGLQMTWCADASKKDGYR